MQVTCKRMTNIPQKESDYIKRINSNFVGQKIKEVYYEELIYESDCEYWNYSNNIHSVDMNVIFKFENDKFLQIKWDNEFYCYGIGFEEIFKIESKEGIKTINVSENDNWKTLIGETISSIEIYWDESESQEFQNKFGFMIPKGMKQKIKLPLSWKLKFINNYIFISAFEIKDNEYNYYWADHLTIFFNEEELIKYKLNQYASR